MRKRKEKLEIEIKPFWIRLFCLHEFTNGVRIVTDKKYRGRHAHICVKCGKRLYID